MRRSTTGITVCLAVAACLVGEAKPPRPGRAGAKAEASGQDDSMRILTRSSAPGLAFQFMPCLGDQQRGSVTSGLRDAFKDPGTGARADVQTSCVGQTNPLDGIETIGVWLSSTGRQGLYGRNGGNAIVEGARQRGLASVALLQDRETFAWSAADWFLDQVREKVWEAQPKRLTRDGTPNPEGSIHLQRLTFGLNRPDRVRTEVRGFIETGVNVDFTARVRDTITVDQGKLRLAQTSDVDAETGWFEAGAIFLSILLPPVGMPLYEDIAAQDGRPAPEEIRSKSLGTMIVQSAPDAIPLEGSRPSRNDPQRLVADKVDFTHQRFAVSSTGVTGGGVHRITRRDPRVSITGPLEPVAMDERSLTLRYATATTDMRFTDDRPLRVSWSADGEVANSTASATRITFTVPNNVAPGRNVTRRVTVEVTDADGLVARRAVNVRINYQNSDRPPICNEKPWLPQCPGGRRPRS